MGCNQSTSMQSYQPNKITPQQSKEYPLQNISDIIKLEIQQSIRKSISDQLTNNHVSQNSKEQLKINQNFESLIENFSQSLQNIIKHLEKIMIKNISKIYLKVSTEVLTHLNNQQISTQQAKLFISEKILFINLEILKVIGKNSDFNYDIKTLQNLNKFQHNLIGYLKAKYPRGKKTFVSSSLIDTFQNFDRTNDYEFDILKNSNTYFGNTDEKAIIKEIKIFFNHIMAQCDEWFPFFQNLMKRQIFNIKNETQIQNSQNQNIRQNEQLSMSQFKEKTTQAQSISFIKTVSSKKQSLLKNSKLKQTNEQTKNNINKIQNNGQETQIQFIIGRKIPQNVPRYQKLQTQALQIYSPQILRTLIKWIEGLQQIIMKPQQKVYESQTFKVYLGKRNQTKSKSINSNQQNSPSYIAESKDKNGFEDQIQQHMFKKKNLVSIKSIIYLIKNNFQGKKKLFDQKNSLLLNRLHQFNINILKIIYTSTRKQAYVPVEQVQVIKYSSFNAMFIEYILTQKLVFAIKELIQIGKSCQQQTKTILDLIKFKVTDLMRCMATGNKKQINQIYKNFVKLDKQGKIKILKIKNRLQTNLNDVMIMFTINNLKQNKKCWIICQAQLILSDSGNKTDKKGKNTDDLNHFFYELQRSPYGILPEIAQRLVYKDSKFSYEKKITFKQNKIDIQKCKRQHKQCFYQSSQQQIPFVCSKCSRFYNKSQNLFKFYECKNCKFQVCCKCILKVNQKFQSEFVMLDIENKLQNKIHQAVQIQIKNNNEQQHNNQNVDTQKLKKKVTINMILKMFQANKFKLKDMLGTQNKVKALILMQKLKEKFKLQEKSSNFIFMVVSFFKRSAQFKWYSYDLVGKVIQNTFDYKQRYESNSNFLFTDYDIIFSINQRNLNQCQQFTKNHVILFGSFMQLQIKMNHMKYLNIQMQIQQQQTDKIISYKIHDQLELVLGYGNLNKSNKIKKKNFKQKSLHQIVKKLPKLNSAQQSLNFQDLGFQNIHLNFFSQIGWRMNIKTLNLVNNKIKDINIILQNCVNLENLNFSQNNVSRLDFNKDFPFLQSLEGSKNHIQVMVGLAFLINIKQLILSQNRMEQFPLQDINSMQNLHVLDISKNRIFNLSSILRYQFKQLYQLIISNQTTDMRKMKQVNQMNRLIQNHSKNENQIIIKYRRLKIFISEQNGILLKQKQIIFKCKQIQQISLLQCGVSKIKFYYKESLQNIKFINLYYNKIKDLSFLLFNYQNQNDLIINYITNKNHSSTQQSVIPSNIINANLNNCIIQNHSLIQLFLGYNQIKEVPILNFSKLKLLSLQMNKISNTKFLQHSILPQIQKINVMMNQQITQIYPLNYRKLKQLVLIYVKSLKNIDKLFTNQSQLESLQRLCISHVKNLDFSFNINSKNNKLKSLKQLQCSRTRFTGDMQEGFFQIDSLQKIQFNYCQFNQLPRMKLPKIKTLSMRSLKCQNLKNLQNCQFNSLEQLDLKNLCDLSYTNFKSYFQQIQKQKQSKQLESQQQIDYDYYFSCKLNFPLLKKLNLSCTQLVSIKGLQYSNLQQLQTLDMEFMKIFNESIPKLFTPKIQQIKVNELKIYNVDFFLSQKMQNLKLLNLIKCQIASLSNEVIEKLVNLEEISLSDNKIINFKSSKQFHNLKTFDISKNKLIGFPQIQAKNLSKLIFQNNPFTDISSMSSFQFPSLESITFSSCDLSKSIFPIIKNNIITQLTFQTCLLINIKNLEQCDLPNLTLLRLYDNKITDVPVLKFPSLEKLYLNKNQIKNVSRLLQLRNTAQNMNYEKNINIQPEIENRLWLSNLKMLLLCQNPIEYLPRLQLPQLQILDLTYSFVNDLSDFAQGNYKNLLTLKFTRNKLTKIPKLKMQSLKQAHFNQNQISDIEGFCQSQLPQLKQLKLKENKLTIIQKLPFPNMKYLILSNNPLTQLSCLNEKEYYNLQQIQINNTHIQKVQIFPKMPKLNSLQMQNNKLRQIQWLVKSAHNIQSVNIIKLYQNQITQIPLQIDDFKKLGRFVISQNPIKNLNFAQSLSNMTKIMCQISLDVAESQYQAAVAKIEKYTSSVVLSRYKKNNLFKLNKNDYQIFLIYLVIKYKLLKCLININCIFKNKYQLNIHLYLISNNIESKQQIYLFLFYISNKIKLIQYSLKSFIKIMSFSLIYLIYYFL